MATDLFKKQLSFDLTDYILAIGIFLMFVGKYYITFSMVAISLVTLLGIGITLYGAYGPTVLVSEGSRF